MNNFVTKLIHKLLFYKNHLVINRNNSNRHVLISYVLFPPKPFDFNFFFNVSHNRYLKSYLMAEYLKKLGYVVHVYDYNNLDVDLTYNYELFIGHNYSFNLIASKLSNKCKKILLTTGSSPQFDNSALEIRQTDLNFRLGTNEKFYDPIKNINYVELNLNLADVLFMIGNKTISDTWMLDNKKKIFYYNNVNKIPFRKKKGRTNNFIYLSSVGQLRRGFDLIVDTFKNRSEVIYICGSYEDESIFKYYSKLIKTCPNIKLMGYVDQTGNQFLEMINHCDFAILPSCSEGQSGSILTLMSYGLIPVITDQVGFFNYESYGLKIENLSLKTVNDIVDLCVKLSDKELESKRICLLQQANHYTTHAFESKFAKMINSLL